MVRQSASKGGATSGAYAVANAAIWVFYAALVLLVTWVLAFSDPVAVTVSVLAAALILRPSAGSAAGSRRRQAPGAARGPGLRGGTGAG